MTGKGLAVVLLFAAMLQACRAPADRPKAQEPAAAPQTTALVERVRAAAQADDAVDVSPLRDAQTEDLRTTASRLEAVGDYVGATQILDQALQLAPQDPGLLQDAAELALLQSDWDRAMSLAGRSFENGPRLGPLCRRNWAMMQVIREHHGDVNGSTAAEEQLGRCTVAPPVRM